MTTKPAAPPIAAPAERFPEMPPREDMQNFDYLNLPGHPQALRIFLGNPERTLITGDAAVGWSVSQQAGKLYPDLMVAFDVDPGAVRFQRGYGIHYHGKPPDFVLEVASYRTAANDYGYKRQRYAEFGIAEYWRFDNTGGLLYPEPLAGDRLAGGAYQPITVVHTGEGMYWGRSEVLKLDLCWEHGELRWHDPATQSYLLTHNQRWQAQLAAEVQRDTAEAQRDAERAARIAAEAERDVTASQRDAERDARMAAEAQLDAAEEARIAAEARARRLEEELRRRHPDSAP